MLKTLSKPALSTFLLAALLLGLGFGPSQLSQAATGSSQSQLNDETAFADKSKDAIGQRQNDSEPTEMYTFDEVAEHNTSGNCWTIIDNGVYNLTSFIRNHPGGSASISKLCGIDGSEIFNSQHGGGEAQIDILFGLRIGTLGANFTPCSTGEFFDAENAICTLAPLGYYITAEQSDAGQVFANPCEPGTFSSSLGSVECQLAPISFYVDQAGQSFATPCPGGQITDVEGSASIDSCYTPTVFIQCEMGSYFNYATLGCVLAPAGSFVPSAGEREATLCPIGTFTSVAGSTECQPAAPGFFINSEGAVQATPCAVGTYSPDAGSEICIQAPIGFYVSEQQQIIATACPDGQVTEAPGATSIQDCYTPSMFIECDPGYFFSDRTGECLPAPAGSYVDLAGATSATKCPAGTYSSSIGSLSCQLATYGYFTANEGSVLATPCAPGSISNYEGASSCELAPAGYFTSEPASTSYLPCAPGSFAATEGSVACVLAPAGYSVPEEAYSEALPCPPGFFSTNEGSISCDAAPAGYSVPNEASTEALPCDLGRFSSEEGSVECQLAPAGYFVSTAASTEAKPCSKGSFAASEGSVSCTKAPRGFYVSTVAATKATMCSKGLTTASTGATSSTSCYKPIVQVLTGFKAPTALKFSAKTNLVATTTAKAVTSFKTTGPCSAKIITLTTKVKGKNVSSKVLSVTAGKTAGTCKIVQTSPEVGKYAAFTKTTSIKISKTGR
jgi:cytochrome b involved in lipid metabolism